jgi:hypothetical protein
MNNNNPEDYFFFITAISNACPPAGARPRFGGLKTDPDA